MNERLFQIWQNKLEIAKQNSRDRNHFPNLLIEIAAQHPLKDGLVPGEEFEERLRMGAQLYRSFHASFERDSIRNGSVHIYVPGSRHRSGQQEDLVSLSEAGRKYLIRMGIPEEDIFGEAMNLNYKGEDGVYNSSDECFVAASIFADGAYRELHCVCAPEQVMRKALSYIAFGVLPRMHCANYADGSHSYIWEAFMAVPALLEDPLALQGQSEQARKLRAERNPDS